MRSQQLYSLAIFVFLCVVPARAQTTRFTYQGSLMDGSSVANGNYDLQFSMYDSLAGGAQVGATVEQLSVPVANGVFSVSLDFGSAALSGANRWLAIAVRHNSGEPYSLLAPRQQISSVPYSVRTLSAQQADVALDAQKLGGLSPTEYVTTTAGAASFIQNQSAQQPSSNFNISGSGSMGALNLAGPATFSGTQPPAVAPAGQARLFFNSATNKLRVSENGAAYIDLVGASGVSGSGAANTLPLWSGATSLSNSVVSQQGSNIGIGTVNPTSRLDVRGDLTLDNGGSPTLFTSTAGTEQNRSLNLINSSIFPSAAGLRAGGILVSDSYGYATPGKNDLIAKGRIGIGNPSPFFQLDVNGAVRTASTSAADVISETVGGTNSWARMVMRSPEQEWALGTSRNYNGNQIYLSDDTNSQARFTIQPGGGAISFPFGNLGIGTTAPAVKLHVSGGGIVESSVQSADERSILSLNSTIGGANRVWTLENGIFGTAGLFGIYDRTAGRAALTVDTSGVLKAGGNVAQARTNNGLPKAMVRVARNGALVQCYNGVDGVSSGNCGGFATTSTGTGAYQLDFPFSVNDRFMTIVAGEGFAGEGAMATYIFSIVSSARMFVYVNKANGALTSDYGFMLIIY